MKTNNIIMGALVAVIAVMGVAFAAFSTTLTINGTASIDSNWSITFSEGSCTVTSKDSNIPATATISVTDATAATATMTVNMKYPGDSATCTVIARNAGDLAAKRTSWALTADGAISDESYTVSVSADTNNVLNTGDTETLKITVTYKDTVTERPTTKATFKAQAVYEQALAN